MRIFLALFILGHALAGLPHGQLSAQINADKLKHHERLHPIVVQQKNSKCSGFRHPHSASTTGWLSVPTADPVFLPAHASQQFSTNGSDATPTICPSIDRTSANVRSDLSDDSLSSAHQCAHNGRPASTRCHHHRTHPTCDHSGLHRSSHNGSGDSTARCRHPAVHPFFPTSSHRRSGRCRSTYYEHGPDASIAYGPNGANSFAGCRLR